MSATAGHVRRLGSSEAISICDPKVAQFTNMSSELPIAVYIRKTVFGPRSMGRLELRWVKLEEDRIWRLSLLITDNRHLNIDD